MAWAPGRFAGQGSKWHENPVATWKYIVGHTKRIAKKEGWPSAWVKEFVKNPGLYYFLNKTSEEIVIDAGKIGPDARWSGAERWYDWLRSLESTTRSAERQNEASQIHNQIWDALVQSSEELKEYVDRSTEESVFISLGVGLAVGAVFAFWADKKLK